MLAKKSAQGSDVMKKTNCWEFTDCRMNIPGKQATENGECPVLANSAEFDGVNCGKGAGRFCWTVAGTLNDAKPHAVCAAKNRSCIDCLFFKYVEVEEMEGFISTKEVAQLWKERRHEK